MEAIRQQCEMSKIQYLAESNEQDWYDLIITNNYVISIDEDAPKIVKIIDKFAEEALKENGFCSLTD